jgi:DNA-binding transcriptional ArsR family regulator
MAFTMTRPAISQHLRILLDAGLVAEQRTGRERRYRLQPDGLDEVDGGALERAGAARTGTTEDGDIELAGEAGTVPEGLRLAADLQPDVVLTDVHLGAHNALQALPELRAAAPGAKVVALSGSSAEQVGADIADVDAYVEKHGVLVNPLAYDGYPSIGCAPCTHRVAPGEDPRSGRWSGQAKTECGIHV